MTNLVSINFKLS